MILTRATRNAKVNDLVFHLAGTCSPVSVGTGHHVSFATPSVSIEQIAGAVGHLD
jgi:hypothetical protein